MCPRDEDKMSCVESAARDWAKALEDREQKRSGVALPEARRAVARRIGVAPGSLENIRRHRTKGVRAWVYESIRAEFMRESEKEIKRLEHELAMARAAGLDTHQDQTGEVAAHLAELRRLTE
jgi:hypothetical protein